MKGKFVYISSQLVPSYLSVVYRGCRISGSQFRGV